MYLLLIKNAKLVEIKLQKSQKLKILQDKWNMMKTTFDAIRYLMFVFTSFSYFMLH